MKSTIAEELARMKDRAGAERFAKGKYETAAQLFEKMMLSGEFNDFLTLPAYQFID